MGLSSRHALDGHFLDVFNRIPLTERLALLSIWLCRRYLGQNENGEESGHEPEIGVFTKGWGWGMVGRVLGTWYEAEGRQAA